MSIPELSQHAGSWMQEVATDYGIVYANMIALKQSNARLTSELASASAALEAMRAKCEAASTDAANLRDQLRGKRLPRPTDRLKG